MTMICTRTSSTPGPIGAEPTLGARSRTAYDTETGLRCVRSSFGLLGLGHCYRTMRRACVRGRQPPLVARLNKGLWSLIGARFRVEH
jgi:hypothetical protein